MKGQLSGISSISAIISGSGKLNARLSNLEQMSATIHEEDTFNEDYSVQTSLEEDVVIHTKNKFMKDDIIIEKVPVSETTNTSGGYTLTIGG